MYYATSQGMMGNRERENCILKIEKKRIEGGSCVVSLHVSFKKKSFFKVLDVVLLLKAGGLTHIRVISSQLMSNATKYGGLFFLFCCKNDCKCRLEYWQR